MDLRLELAVDLEMTPLEVRAYKLTLLWLEKSKKVFPDYNHLKIKKNVDPRKSSIFKYCYKLARETQNDILKEEDYPIYITAQLEILRIMTSGKPLVHPSCLAGEKAWRRWKLWKKKYDQRKKIIEEDHIPANQVKVIEALERTKEFLTKSFDGQITLEKLQSSVLNKSFERWIKIGKISPYYLVLCPHINVLFPNGIDKMNLSSYQITPEMKEYYNKMFS